MKLNKKEKLRKQEIENHFENILKKAKTYEQINGFYRRIVLGLIPLMLINFYWKDYNYEGFTFNLTDLHLISLIFQKHHDKVKIVNSLK